LQLVTSSILQWERQEPQPNSVGRHLIKFNGRNFAKKMDIRIFVGAPTELVTLDEGD